MPKRVRETLVSARDLALAWGPFVLLGAVLLAAAYWLLDPTPPKRVVLATGPERSAYAEFGKRYAAELKRFGITVELRTTTGSRDNLRLLRPGRDSPTRRRSEQRRQSRSRQRGATRSRDRCRATRP